MQAIKTHEVEVRPTYSKDETCVNAGDALFEVTTTIMLLKEVYNRNTDCELKKPARKGDRAITLLAGCEDGFVQDAAGEFQTKEETGDCTRTK